MFPRSSIYSSQSKATKGSNSTNENYKNVNKIVIIQKNSYQLGHIICLLYIIYNLYMSTFTQIMVNLIIYLDFGK